MKTAIVVAVVVVLLAVVGAGAFYAGQQNGLTQAQNTRAEFFQQRSGQGGGGGFGQGQGGQFGQGGQNARRPSVFGTVKSVQNGTIQVTMADGSSATVTTDAQTVIVKTVTGAISDVQPGERITVQSDVTGTNVLARQISIQPGQPTAQQ